jgi:hypothetical protein
MGRVVGSAWAFGSPPGPFYAWSMLRITLDTNVLDADKIARIREATAGLDVDLASRHIY